MARRRPLRSAGRGRLAPARVLRGAPGARPRRARTGAGRFGSGHRPSSPCCSCPSARCGWGCGAWAAATGPRAGRSGRGHPGGGRPAPPARAAADAEPLGRRLPVPMGREGRRLGSEPVSPDAGGREPRRAARTTSGAGRLIGTVGHGLSAAGARDVRRRRGSARAAAGLQAWRWPPSTWPAARCCSRWRGGAATAWRLSAYVWNPLLVVEGAGMGHVDVLGASLGCWLRLVAWRRRAEKRRPA